MSIQKTFTINSQPISVSFDDDNHIAEYFDLEKFKSNWHDFRAGEYHFSLLLSCLRDYYLKIINNQIETNLETLGNFHIGSILHKEIQEFIEKKYGFCIIERPLLDEIEIAYEHNGMKFEDIIRLVGKADLLDISQDDLGDIKTTRYMPILEKLEQDDFEAKYGKYIVQALVYAFYLNHTYFQIQPLKKVKLIMVLKANLTVKVIWIDYEEETALFFYKLMRQRAEYLHLHIMKNEMPECEINKYCPNCSNISLCPEGTEYAESLKAPVSFETTAFNKKYPDKKAHIKRDGEWKETKAFTEFKAKELKTKKS